LGVTSDTPIASLDLTLQGSTFNGDSVALVDNFQFGNAAQDMSQAPEAATFLLIGSGLIGIAILKKWIGRKGSA
jgi:threonine dehydrogenase-like Zn-dependent dehydrogenase